MSEHMSVEEYLAIPYEIEVTSVPTEDGEWVRRAALPELSCVVEATGVLDALDRLDDERIKLILDRVEAGAPIPVPRPPLESELYVRSMRMRGAPVDVRRQS